MIKKLNIQIILFALFYILIRFLDFHFSGKEILAHFINDTFIILGGGGILLYVAALVVWKFAKYPVDCFFNMVVFFLMTIYIKDFILYGFKGYFSYGIFLMPYAVLMLFIGIVIYHFVNIAFIKKLPKMGQITCYLIILFAILYYNTYPFQHGKRMISNLLNALFFLMLFITYHVKLGGFNIQSLKSAKD